jgi:hypothetical protein
MRARAREVQRGPLRMHVAVSGGTLKVVMMMILIQKEEGMEEVGEGKQETRGASECRSRTE